MLKLSISPCFIAIFCDFCAFAAAPKIALRVSGGAPPGDPHGSGYIDVYGQGAARTVANRPNAISSLDLTAMRPDATFALDLSTNIPYPVSYRTRC